MQTRWRVGHISNKWARSHKDGAGDRDRTGMASLEGWGSTIELHPHVLPERRFLRLWVLRGLDYRVGKQKGI